MANIRHPAMPGKQTGEQATPTLYKSVDPAKHEGYSLDELLSRNPALWRGCNSAGQGNYGQPTGYPELDNILPGRGWPRNAMMEITSPHWGVGELQLLVPLMRKVVAEGKWILWISPPYLLYAPALTQAGIDTDRILVINLDTSCRDALWSMEKALQTESCGLVLAWQRWLPNRVMRRLQLAAEAGETLGVLFHHTVSKHSQSYLSLKIESHFGNAAQDHNNMPNGVSGESEVTVIRARGNFRPLSTRLTLQQPPLHGSEPYPTRPLALKPTPP